jgi:hypothetical protein
MFVSLSNVPGLWLTLGIMTLILVGMGILSPWRKPNNNRIYLPPIALITGVLYTLLTIGWGNIRVDYLVLFPMMGLLALTWLIRLCIWKMNKNKPNQANEPISVNAGDPVDTQSETALF